MAVPKVYNVNKLLNTEDGNEHLLTDVVLAKAIDRAHEIIKNHDGPIRWRRSWQTSWSDWMLRPQAQSRIDDAIAGLRKGVSLIWQAKPVENTAWSVRCHILPYRQRIYENAMWGVKNEPQIHYDPIRPIDFEPVKALPETTDCSGFVTKCYRWAGLPDEYDPNGFGFSGAGSSFAMDQHLPTIGTNEARVGDPIVFDGHVAVVVQPGPDPLLVSHGMERGPIAIRLSQERRYHNWFKAKRGLPF